jgi:hypothetical protein
MATAEPPSPMSLPDVNRQKAARASSDAMMPVIDVSTAEVNTKGGEDAQGTERTENETSHKPHQDADTSAGAEGSRNHDHVKVDWAN